MMGFGRRFGVVALCFFSLFLLFGSIVVYPYQVVLGLIYV